MYDTTNLGLHSQGFSSSQFDLIGSILSNAEIKSDAKTSEFKSIEGNILGLRARMTEREFYLCGSICKAHLNNNLETLTRADTKEFFEKISDMLHLPIYKAKVTRLDIAHNLQMNHEIENYFPFLGECNYLIRLPQPNCLYYKNGLRMIAFYDKIAESKSSRCIIPNDFRNINLLRYELRFLKKLANQLNVAVVLAEDLYDEHFYKSLNERWLFEYQKIKKNNLLTPKTKAMTSKDANDYLLASLIEQQGQSNILNQITLWKGLFNNEREFYRFREKILKMKDLTQPSELLAELDSKIYQQAITF